MAKINKTLNIIDKNGNVLKSLLIGNSEEFKVRIDLYISSERSIEAVDSNYFKCLVKIRKILELNGESILCQGAVTNVYPSRMSIQMGRGLKAYKLTLGRQADLSSLVDIFAPASADEVGTIFEQESFYLKWIKSLIT